MMTREDRIKGVLLGQAAGDALGAPYEFGPPVDPQAVTMRGKAWGKAAEDGTVTWLWEPGEWTDDTQQAIIVALARSDQLKVAEGILAWYRGRPKDVGISTGQVLSGAEKADDVLYWSRVYGEARTAETAMVIWSQRPVKDPGLANGSLMRTGPVALPFLGNRERVARAACEISDVTHADPTGYTGDATVIWSLLINDAIELGDKFSLVQSLADSAGATSHPGYWASIVADAHYTDPTGQRNGGVVGAFKAALHAVTHGTDVESTVRLAVSFGRDTDTVAAIAGALAGAIYGASSIPQAWLNVLHGWSPEGTMGADALGELALSAAA